MGESCKAAFGLRIAALVPLPRTVCGISPVSIPLELVSSQRADSNRARASPCAGPIARLHDGCRSGSNDLERAGSETGAPCKNCEQLRIATGTSRGILSPRDEHLGSAIWFGDHCSRASGLLIPLAGALISFERSARIFFFKLGWPTGFAPAQAPSQGAMLLLHHGQHKMEPPVGLAPSVCTRPPCEFTKLVL